MASSLLGCVWLLAIATCFPLSKAQAVQVTPLSLANRSGPNKSVGSLFLAQDSEAIPQARGCPCTFRVSLTSSLRFGVCARCVY